MRKTGIFLLCAALLACSPRTYQTVDGPGPPVVATSAVVEKPTGRAIGPVLDAQGDTVIGHADVPLTKAQPESTLGNFVADAMLAAALKMDKDVVAAVCNYGGIRLAYLPPGPITKVQLRQLMPFDNVLIIIEMSGSTLLEFCNLIARRKGWPVSGLSFLIRDGTAADVVVQGEELSSGRVYKVAVSNYLAKGGDECSFLQGLPMRRSRILIRNALEDQISVLEKEGRPLHPVLERRIRYAE